MQTVDCIYKMVETFLEKADILGASTDLNMDPKPCTEFLLH